MKANKKLRVLSVLLILCLAMALVPVAAFAATDDSAGGNQNIPGNLPFDPAPNNPAPLTPQVSNETDVTVVKKWDCNIDLIPESVEVILICVENDDPREVDSAILSEANGWSYTWTGLPLRGYGGYKLAYSVEEVAVPGFASSIAAPEPNYFEITNTFQFNPAPMNPAPVQPDDPGTPDADILVEEDAVAVPKTGDAVSYALPLLLLMGAAALLLVRRQKD